MVKSEIDMMHDSFYESLKAQHANEIHKAEERVGGAMYLKKLIVGDIGETTVLVKEFDISEPSAEGKEFYQGQYQKFMVEMKGKLQELGLPDDVFDQAVDFGLRRFALEHPVAES